MTPDGSGRAERGAAPMTTFQMEPEESPIELSPRGASTGDGPPATDQDDAAQGVSDTGRVVFPVRMWWVVGVSVVAVVASALQIGLGLRERGLFLLALCFAVCGVAAWIDVATRRIPNVLTYPAIVIGLLLNALLPPFLEIAGADVAVIWLGATGLRDGLLGFGLCAFIGIVSFIARGLGGGDVKLLGAVGAMLGLHAVVPVLFNTLVVAAIVGLANWALRGTLVPRLQVTAGNLMVAAFTKRGLTKVYPFGRSEAPFGLSLLIGLALAQFVALHRFILGPLLEMI